MNAITASNLEVRLLELSEAELDDISGGYIGETEKNLSRGTRTDTTSAATSTCIML